VPTTSRSAPADCSMSTAGDDRMADVTPFARHRV
jgi:hypothetical protein